MTDPTDTAYIAKDIQIKHYYDYYQKCIENPTLSKNEVCTNFHYRAGKLNSIQKEYDLPSPFRLGFSPAITEEQKRSNMIRNELKKLDQDKTSALKDEFRNASTVQQRDTILSRYNKQESDFLPSTSKVSSKKKKNIKDKKAGKGRTTSNIPEVHPGSLGPLSSDEMQLIINRRNAAQTSGSSSIRSNSNILNEVVNLNDLDRKSGRGDPRDYPASYMAPYGQVAELRREEIRLEEEAKKTSSKNHNEIIVDLQNPAHVPSISFMTYLKHDFETTYKK